MLRMKTSPKHITAYFIVGAGAVFLVFSTLLISDPTSITFRSEASEDLNKVHIAQRASASIDLAESELPECVKRLSYISDKTDAASSCLVSIECNDAMKGMNNNCSYSGNAISCYAETQCLTIKEWTDQARDMCGC